MPSAYSQGAYAPTVSKPKTPMKVWVKRIALTLVVLFVVSFVVEWRREAADPYSQLNQEAFVRGCTHSGGSDGTCRCAFDWIKHNVPAETFKAYAKAAAAPGYSASQLPGWAYTAINSCMGR